MTARELQERTARGAAAALEITRVLEQNAANVVDNANHAAATALLTAGDVLDTTKSTAPLEAHCKASRRRQAKEGKKRAAQLSFAVDGE
jgi:hypothetical protein